MKVLLLVALACIMPFLVSAQKIAYADINAIIGVMPENENINSDLQIYATGLQKRIDDMKAQLEGFGQQFQQALNKRDTATAIAIQEKAVALDKQLQESTRQAEQQLQQKRNEMMQPVLARIRKAMETVSKRDGYEYVLNSIDGAGTSIVLYGPENDNITLKLVDELGIKLEGREGEKPAETPAPAKDAKKK
jgi:outer membrane protein